jgi:hypothetical protein
VVAGKDPRVGTWQEHFHLSGGSMQDVSITCDVCWAMQYLWTSGPYTDSPLLAEVLDWANKHWEHEHV